LETLMRASGTGDDSHGSSTAFLSVRDVRKHYATVKAVDGITFDVRSGEILALLGPNGAGKTTLLRMLVGITRPDSGQVRFTGRDAALAPQELGYLPEDRGLYQDMPVVRTMTYFGRLRGMSAREADEAARAWLERLGLADRAEGKLGALSKGNQQKVQFAVAVLHRPRFAILDEPFSGLDPINQELFLGLVRELRDGGCTVLLSAHQMALVERLADRVIVMHRGTALLEGAIGDLTAGGSLHDLYISRVGEANLSPADASPPGPA
jgi:ABC-2 type transport system ATP-binding protein